MTGSVTEKITRTYTHIYKDIYCILSKALIVFEMLVCIDSLYYYFTDEGPHLASLRCSANRAQVASQGKR